MKEIEGLTTEEERAAAVFRALGNPARIRIVTELARRNVCATGDFVDVLPLAQSTVSQHLKVSEGSGHHPGRYRGRPVLLPGPGDGAVARGLLQPGVLRPGPGVRAGCGGVLRLSTGR